MFKTRSKAARHRHSYNIVGVEHIAFERGYPETLIHRRCACGQKYTETLRGTWTRAMLTGDDA